MDLSGKVRPEKERCDLLSAHIKGLTAFFLRVSLFQIRGQNFSAPRVVQFNLYRLSEWLLPPILDRNAPVRLPALQPDPKPIKIKVLLVTFISIFFFFAQHLPKQPRTLPKPQILLMTIPVAQHIRSTNACVMPHIYVLLALHLCTHLVRKWNQTNVTQSF